MATSGSIEHPHNAGDWTVTLAGKAVEWERIEFTLEQFHVPASFAVSAPLDSVDIKAMLSDAAPEVVISYKGKSVFVGIVDESEVSLDQEDEPEEVVNLSGRDLSARLVLAKVVDALPQNRTASEMVTQFCKDVGLTDTSQITATTAQVGEFVKGQYSHVTQKLTKHDVIHDLAENEDFVFRVHGRTPYFGPIPAPKKMIPLAYQVHFNQAHWRKSHANADVQVRVLSWGKKKQKISSTAGSGSLIIQRVVPGISALQAKNLASRILDRAEKGLLSLDITGVPGDATLDDILFAFDVKGIAPGVDQVWWPSRIHHVITQDDHVMDLALYNAKRILA